MSISKTVKVTNLPTERRWQKGGLWGSGLEGKMEETGGCFSAMKKIDLKTSDDKKCVLVQD